jgi:hypothetical protein
MARPFREEVDRLRRRQARQEEPPRAVPMISQAQAALLEQVRDMEKQVADGRITYIAAVCVRPSGESLIMNQGLVSDIWKVIGLLNHLIYRLNRMKDQTLR